MYKSLYEYTSNDANALSFTVGERFTLIDSRKDPHWWLVHNAQGQVGFVPANYLEKDQASLEDVMKSIDRAIAAIHASAQRAKGGYTSEQRTNLKKLEQHKQNVLHRHQPGVTASRPAPEIPASSSTKRQSMKMTAVPPPPPERNSSSMQPNHASDKAAKSNATERVTTSNATKKETVSNGTTSPASNTKQQPDKVKTEMVINQASVETSSHLESPSQGRDESLTETAKNATVSTQYSVSSANVFASPSAQKARSHTQTMEHVIVPKELGSELVEKIRCSTKLSYHDSVGAVHTVISHLSHRVPELEGVMGKVLERLQEELDRSDIDLTSDDAKRLEHIFEELAECKDDSQQRSWFLHEDEHFITEHLEELLSILNGANSDVCKAVIASDDYAAVHNLVVYYQMETRLNLRMLLLQVFGSLCGISGKIISELLTSVLPSELARDIQTDTQEIQKFCYSALVLAMIFSMGEPIPQQYYTELNESFVGYMLDTIEEPPAADVAMQIPDLLVNVILAFNLHFELPEDNTVMRVIAARDTAKVFTEKVMLLVNRGDDPVKFFEHKTKPPNSVLKFFADLYSTPETSNLLYTNDVKVLIDIILGQITDLNPGDSLRTEHLSIAELLLKNHKYSEHCHRRAELETCFKRIYKEEEPSCDMDKRIVAQIWKDNPDLFESDCI